MFHINPPNDKLDFIETDFDTFANVINNFNNTNNLISIISTKFNGMSKCFITNVLEELNIDSDSYSDKELKEVYNFLKQLVENIGTQNVVTVNKNNKDYVLHLEKNDEPLQTNFFLDDYYKEKEDTSLLVNYRNNLLKLVYSSLKKITKKVNNIDLKLKECKNMDTYRIYGELITANLYRINNDVNISTINLENYYDNNKLIDIPLDNSISPQLNAKNFFKKYNKLKNTLDIVSKQKIEASKELNYLESIIYELEDASTIEDLEEIDSEISENVLFKNNNKYKNNNNSHIKKNKINKRKVHDEYEPITYNVDGFTLYVGKNNKQNDYITTKLGKNEDLWFHTKDARGSHCLLKCNGSKVSDDTIVACCKIAAYHSKARLSSNVPVDYCYIRNVKKPSNSKPGMVVFTNNKTINVNPKI